MILRWWRRVQRHADVVFLWRQLRERADRDWAEKAFYLHMRLDPAYSDMSEEEKQKFIERLPERDT